MIVLIIVKKMWPILNCVGGKDSKLITMHVYISVVMFASQNLLCFELAE